MALPTIDEFLASLSQMRADCLAHRDRATAEGDQRAARSFTAQAAKIEKMILKKGGTIQP
jgi:demethoxyubiquinone hydroxylase (CLK1/Coq7/Cat5 family)